MTAITEFDHVSRLIYYDVTLSDLTGCDTLLMGLTGSDVAAVMAGTQRPLSGPSRPCSTGRFYWVFFLPSFTEVLGVFRWTRSASTRVSRLFGFY